VNLRAQNEREHKENASNLSTVIIQEARIRELTDSLQQQASNFEQERQLMAASKDVRQLMGARNLHIMDVHDTDGAGKSAKASDESSTPKINRWSSTLSTCRAEGLPRRSTHSKPGSEGIGFPFSPQSWTFAVDDHEQRRWVLKVNNPKLLKGIDQCSSPPKLLEIPENLAARSSSTPTSWENPTIPEDGSSQSELAERAQTHSGEYSCDAFFNFLVSLFVEFQFFCPSQAQRPSAVGILQQKGNPRDSNSCSALVLTVLLARL